MFYGGIDWHAGTPAERGPQVGDAQRRPSSIILMISTACLPRGLTDATRCRRPLAHRVALATRQSCLGFPRVTRQNGSCVSLRLCRCAPLSSQTRRQVAFRMDHGHRVCRIPDTPDGSSTSPTPQCEGHRPKENACQPNPTVIPCKRSWTRRLSKLSTAPRRISSEQADQPLGSKGRPGPLHSAVQTRISAFIPPGNWSRE